METFSLGSKRVADARLDVRTLDLVDVVIDREPRAERHVEAELAVDLDRVGLAGQRPHVRSVIEIVGIDVPVHAACQGRLPGGKAHLRIRVELGEVEGSKFRRSR